MVFSSIIFLYAFLPVVLLGYFIVPGKFKNTFLFLSSLVFFAWGGVSYSVLLLFSIVFNYYTGKAIGKRVKGKRPLVVGLVVNLLMLFVFKYLNFAIDNINTVISWFDIPVVENPPIVLPVGISFYTFQAMSYLMDVYRQQNSYQKSIVNLGLYISLFPQLIAGPIVRYHDIDAQIRDRSTSFEKFSSGALHFCLGLAKKVLIANNLALVADQVFALTIYEMTTLYAWIGILAYALQIYYDFSGYSDMAIGLGRMFGFDILENFNFPYISQSIKEFWRRWHISLSTWFRDYLYIPLGGNRKSASRTYLNLLIVFVVTGFWHGANWNFLIWGLIHGMFLIIERLGFGRVLERIPKIFRHIYVLLTVLIAWVFFRVETPGYAFGFIANLAGAGQTILDPYLFKQIVNTEVVIVFAIAILGALGVFSIFKKYLKFVVESTGLKELKLYWIGTTLKSLFIIAVLFLATTYLISGTYNPFIYYRF